MFVCEFNPVWSREVYSLRYVVTVGEAGVERARESDYELARRLVGFVDWDPFFEQFYRVECDYDFGQEIFAVDKLFGVLFSHERTHLLGVGRGHRVPGLS